VSTTASEPARKPALSGRRAEAARNDGRILDAARSVFLADPEAPVSKVAASAGVGISALYRRYPSKEHLLRALAEDGLTRYAASLESALASDADPWTAYVTCLHEVLDGRSQALAQRLAGTFTPTQALTATAVRAGRLAETLFRRVRKAGELRDDVSEADIVLLLETVSLVELPGADGGAALRRRYLTLMLQALRAPAAGPLPGPPAPDADLAARWRVRLKPPTTE
jgi:AcrR family transcriptional regulator